MKILLVYPEYPDSFWSYKHVIKLFGIRESSILKIGFVLKYLKKAKFIS
jgi:hypothetical protein